MQRSLSHPFRYPSRVTIILMQVASARLREIRLRGVVVSIRFRRARSSAFCAEDIELEGLVAQLVEQCPFKALVRGSSPRQPTNFAVENPK